LRGDIAFQFKFAANIGSVGVDSAVADEDLLGDVLAGLVFGYQSQDSVLHRREGFEAA
jgi:hypothetical protein